MLKWHPDRNPGKDVNSIIKDIIEAYNILKDEELRKRYDKEYAKVHEKENKQKDSEQSKYGYSYKDDKKNSYTYEYDVEDEELKREINKVRKQVDVLLKDLIKNIRSDIRVATDGAWKALKPFLILFAITMGIMLFAMIMAKLNGEF